ncbi:MAG: cell division protein FtsH [Acidobacterium sp.]|nr:ATP-dependent metallopeptidase FtsH/Yme1/Tma family protein [Acidobacteriota bacterium]PHY10754.1 MAG: cell division protein FtsH [Acidobacterium sp.]
MIVLVALVWNFSSRFQRNESMFSFSEFVSMVDSGQVARVKITGNELTGLTQAKEPFRTYIPGQYEGLVNRLIEKKVIVEAKEPTASPWAALLMSWAPILLLIGFWIFFMRQVQSGGNKALSFGKSKAKLSSSTQKKVTFRDVAGAEEAKSELQEIIEFLKEPQKFQKLGGRIPKGVLLMGPPGTGKTLLARAVAGEANVPFFSISGSDFVEMFVGVGASRVRDLFEQGKKNAPCIIFIDEIDAVGRHRGAGLGGGHDEREQTLNQLLVEMDGFESNEGVILMAATNRPDVLDPALLRPGRFDRRVIINRPDVRGREGILAVHTRKIPMSDDVDIKILARGTVGFTGADLANLVNEAALNAARDGKKLVSMYHFEYAKDKVMMGAERRSMIVTEDEKKVTAIHEAGHALLGMLLPHADPLHKVTIVPRGMALGLTMSLPTDEKHNYSKNYLVDQIGILLGGRIAEEITTGNITTGAGNDLERATDLARRMVCEWGMSESMGPLTFGKKEEQIFLGREIAQHSDYSEDTALKIDSEVQKIVSNQYTRCTALLTENKQKLTDIADALLAREVLDADQVRRIVNGHPLDDAPPAEVPAVDAAPAQKERPSLVPPMQPIQKPLTQE